MLDKTETVFHSIIQMEGVRKYIKKNLHEQLQKTFENEKVINQAINGAKGVFK